MYKKITTLCINQSPFFSRTQIHLNACTFESKVTADAKNKLVGNDPVTQGKGVDAKERPAEKLLEYEVARYQRGNEQPPEYEADDFCLPAMFGR